MQSLAILTYLTCVAIISHGVGYLLVNEEGLFDILKKFRRLVGISKTVEVAIEEGDYEVVEGLNPFAKMLTCGICTSTFISLVLGVFLCFNLDFPDNYPYLLEYLSPFVAMGLTLILKKV